MMAELRVLDCAVCRERERERERERVGGRGSSHRSEEALMMLERRSSFQSSRISKKKKCASKKCTFVSVINRLRRARERR